MIRSFKSDSLWFAAAELIPFSLYLATLCRGIPVGDSAELAMAAANLQIAHPPGYPLLTILGNLWTHIFFFLRPIVALNLASAACAAAGSVALFQISVDIFRIRTISAHVASLSLAIAFAASRTLWSVAANFEVYALSALFSALILLSLLRFLRQGEPRLFYLAVFLLGLSLCNHLSLLALVPAFVIVVIAMRSRLKLRDYAIAGVFSVLPAGLYLYLVIRSRFDLVLSWYNPRNWQGLKQQVFAESYQRFVVAPNFGDLGPYLHQLTRLFANEFVLPFVVLAVGGIIIQWQKRRTFALMLIATVLANCALNFSYTISDIAPYYLPTIIAIVIWFSELFVWMVQRSRLLAIAAVAISILVAAITVAGNYQRSDLSNRTKSEFYAKDLFDRTPAGAMLFCGSDNSMFPALYLRYVENYRSDCGVYGHLPTLTHLQRDLGYPSDGDWTFFPTLLKNAVASHNRPIVLTRELMNFDTNYPRLLDNLITHDLVYLVDSTLSVPTGAFRVDFANIPAIYDPKEALMYTVYLLASAESSPDRRDYNRAVKLVNSLDDPALSSSLAAYFADAEQHQLAISVIEPALKLNHVRQSERLQLLGGLGASHLRLQNTAAAKIAFEQMLAIDSADTEAQFQLLALQASGLAANGNYSAAIVVYEQMEKLAPAQNQVTMQLALLYIRTNNITAARAALLRCIDSGYQAETAASLIRDLDSAGK
ncbi:MAG: DUF2723 domain-containing protein [Candidatus Zixiibacteriota bacterium]